MEREQRHKPRQEVDCEVVLSWQDDEGTQFIRARGSDLSPDGVSIDAEQPLAVGARVFVRAPYFGLASSAAVRHCRKRGARYIIGLKLHGSRARRETKTTEAPGDWYEVLQVSPSAELETIHRVFKILAGRYHPDNAFSGDAEKFLTLMEAYNTLSDPEKRAAYDSGRRQASTGPLPVFEMKEFIAGIDVEANRRLGVLCLLYKRRASNPDHPGLSLLQFESLMAIPREHIEFTVWFLKEKRFIRVADHGEFQITAEGVEFAETSLPAKSALRKLLGAGHHESSNTSSGSEGD